MLMHRARRAYRESSRTYSSRGCRVAGAVVCKTSRDGAELRSSCGSAVYTTGAPPPLAAKTRASPMPAMPTMDLLLLLLCLLAALPLSPAVRPGSQHLKTAAVGLSLAPPMLPRGVLNITAPPHSVDSSGTTDVTVALRAAIASALASDQVVFVPLGRYLISDTIEIAQSCDLFKGRSDGGINIVPCRFRPNVVVGSAAALPERPTFVLAPNALGYSNISAPKNVVKLTNSVQENVNMNQAFRSIDIEVGAGNPGAIGIYAQGAQGMSVDDVHVDMTRGGFAGFAGGNGAGGSHVNIRATGGRFGVYFTQADGAALVLSATLVGQSVSAIFYGRLTPVQPWEAAVRSASLVGLSIHHAGTGPAIDAREGHAITVLDSEIDCMGGPSSVAISAQGNAYLSDVFSSGCKTLLSQSGSRHPDLLAPSERNKTTRAVEVARGINTPNRGALAESDLIYVDGVRHLNRSITDTTRVTRVPADLISRRVLWDSRSFPSLETATDAVQVCGAKGDGITDDTLSLQRCLDTHDQVLLPKGCFRISSTLTMRPGTALVGISQTHSVIAPLTTGFASSATDPEDYAPLLRTAVEGNATLAFVGLITWWHLPSIYTLDWRARGGLWRSNYETRVCECLWLTNYLSRASSTACAAAPTVLGTPKTQVRGGGEFLNFVNDEDILFTDHTHYRHLRVSDGGAGSHPARFYALNMEHAMSEANLEINGAMQGVEIVSLKIEGSNTALWIRDSANVSLYSLGGGSDAFPNSSYFPSDFSKYAPTIIRVERTSPYKLVNLNDGGRGNEGNPIEPIPMTGKRNGFPLNHTILSAYPWPAFMLDPIIKSMWAPWPGYAVPSRMWRLLLEADSPSKVVHQTQPHELPIIDSRDPRPRLKTVDGAATISYVEPGTTISTGTVLQQPSQPLSPHQCSAGAACHDGTQPPCSPPPPLVPQHPPLPACHNHRCQDDLVNSGIVGAFPDGSNACNSTQVCVQDVFPGCDCYRGDSNSQWGIWCDQAIAAFDSGGVVNGTNMTAHSAPTNIGVGLHNIYYFAAHGKPKYYVLYLPPTNGEPHTVHASTLLLSPLAVWVYNDIHT